MKDELFQELLESVREGGAILRGQTLPSRSFEAPPPDVRQIRASYELSQPEFAALLGISVATLRNWEQGRRSPEGPAKVLLRVAAKHPRAVWDVVRPQDSRITNSRITNSRITNSRTNNEDTKTRNSRTRKKAAPALAR